jgi:hypothetical protein
MSRLPIRFPEENAGAPSLANTVQRYEQHAQNYSIGNYRSIPTHRRAWHVTTTVLRVPDWFLDVFALPSLSSESRSFWIRHRNAAQKIVKLDHEAGGHGCIRCVQFRLCRVRRQALIGAAAHEYTERMRLPRFRWEFPQGPACGMECVPKRKPMKRAS